MSMHAVSGLLSLFLSVLSSSSSLEASHVDDHESVQATEEPVPDSMLIFSKTAGFRHDSIPEGVACLRKIAAELGLSVIATEDSAVFTSKNLASCAVVVFLNTTGDVLNAAQEAVFESYIREGGAWFGVHAAADTEYDWPFYGRLVGAYFKSHPAIQPADVRVEVANHPSTRMLPGLWRRTDEWYTYRLSPREGVTVLASLDEDSFTGGGMNGDHPIAWCHEFEGGRSLYTGGGHTRESYVEPKFVAHLKGAVEWLINSEPASREEVDEVVVPQASESE